MNFRRWHRTTYRMRIWRFILFLLHLQRLIFTFGFRKTSQRDIFASFSYSLGTTPQAVLDELWVALPSLRQLFDYNGGWNCVTKETWWRLFEAVLGQVPSLFPSCRILISFTEPDVLRFAISLLTAAALTDAIQAALVQKYEYAAKWNAEMARRRHKSGSGLKHVVEAESKVRAKREKRAAREAEGVVQDVQEVLRISDVSYGFESTVRWWKTDSIQLG
jgi:hypothetical protein